MNPSAILLRDVCKRFGEVTAVDSVSLEIGSGEFFSLLGPSGCGKTTLLRLIGGFEDADSGSIQIAGTSVKDLPPRQRPVNTVFQNYALFPHLTVFENVAFGLRVRRIPEEPLLRKVDELLELLHLSELRERTPGEISGGQKQRVALARALAVEPKVLLLDEPMAAIDAQRRIQVQDDLKEIQRRLGTTFLHVTHDQDEALSLSDRVAVMNAGRVEQIGTPREIYERPVNSFVASFIGRCNILRGRLAGADGNLSLVQTPVGLLRMTLAGSANATGAFGIRGERVLLGNAGADNVFHGEILAMTYSGASIEYRVRVGEQQLLAIANGMTRYAVGENVLVSLPTDALFPLSE